MWWLEFHALNKAAVCLRVGSHETLTPVKPVTNPFLS